MSSQTTTLADNRPAPRAGSSRGRTVGLMVDAVALLVVVVVAWMLYPSVPLVVLLAVQYLVLAWMCWRIGGRTPGMYVIAQLFWRRPGGPTADSADDTSTPTQNDRTERVAEAGFASAAPSRFRQDHAEAPAPRPAPTAPAPVPEVLPSPVAADAPSPRQPIPFAAEEPQEQTVVPAQAFPAEETVIPEPRAQRVLELSDGERIDLGGQPVVLGRKPFQPDGIAPARLVTVPDDTRMVSRAHCVIEASSEPTAGPRITDLGSANGTTVERAGERHVLGAGEPLELQAGDALLLGQHRLVVR
ncbi:FHA domain-containing protein [Citricoccus muralis]|uniref:FHA domain-containing protein n=1 Tax=Citricoccus muralis TaxID=169134 RepID=A0ABY8H819_9MICC|nr:FHA domain-containing protein [Citricoccus muralis]WFP16798.1 FHA domain-containing protein [Citricoccus muralis]